ncbi:hypothetical protein C7B61_14035 [filamentous cyanobacterium CCP1]|nr:hypothetical protein C7B61_14035 [filamentous cyanobacterium CCP1]
MKQMYTDKEALSLIQNLSPGESVQWWEAPALLDHHLEGTPGSHSLSLTLDSIRAEKGFRCLILSYKNKPSDILKAEDWKSIFMQLEMLARFHVALGTEYTLPLSQVLQSVHHLPFEGTYWTILPLEVWTNLFRKLEACYHPAEWKALTDGLKWLQEK